MLKPHQNFDHAIFFHFQIFVDPRDRTDPWQSLTHATRETTHPYYPHYLAELQK